MMAWLNKNVLDLHVIQRFRPSPLTTRQIYLSLSQIQLHRAL